ncbi:hypothetical protein GCM10027072_11060 [Streptomyces bullii]
MSYPSVEVLEEVGGKELRAFRAGAGHSAAAAVPGRRLARRAWSARRDGAARRGGVDAFVDRGAGAETRVPGGPVRLRCMVEGPPLSVGIGFQAQEGLLVRAGEQDPGYQAGVLTSVP